MAATVPDKRPRASLHTIGCRLNQAETALLADRLKRDGYEIVAYGQPTDLLVLNTCSVTEDAERGCRYEIRKTLRHSPGAFVAVTGCYAQTGADALSRMDGVDLIVGTAYKMRLPDYLPAPPVLRKRPSPALLHQRRIEQEDFILDGVGDFSSARAQLKIQDGCDFMCSFCLIPFARGRERSRRPDDVLREAAALVSRGHRELVLTGVNLGRYDCDGMSLLDLIRALEQIPELDRIRISSIEPTTISDALLDHMAASAKLCRYLHVPLQSGDDAVLQAMNRRYRAADYAAFAQAAATLIPDLCLGTDVMVGFPGEDERAFEQTMELFARLPLAYGHVFSFSPRPGTAAARLPGGVADRVAKARSRRLAELSRAKRLAYYQRAAGRTFPVLFEHQEPDGRWSGLTGHYIRVAVDSPQPLRNRLEPVTLTGVTDGLAFGCLGGREQALS